MLVIHGTRQEILFWLFVQQQSDWSLAQNGGANGPSTSHVPAMFLRNNSDSGVTNCYIVSTQDLFGNKIDPNHLKRIIEVKHYYSRESCVFQQHSKRQRRKSNPNIVANWFFSIVLFFFVFSTFMWDPWAISGPQFHLSSARLAHHAQVQPAASVAVEQRQHQGREDLRFHGIQTELLKITNY